MAGKNKLNRREFLTGALAAGGLLTAHGAGYRIVSNQRGRRYDVARSAMLPGGIAPGTPDDLPNIVLILADELGYGDLGCYGSLTIQTPYLDQMAREGVLMTNFCCSAPLRSPVRAGLLTGRYPIRTRVPTSLYPANSLEDEVLLPKLLQRRGYRTALLGKGCLPNEQVELPAPTDQTQEATAFIRENVQRPFFLAYAQPSPHIPLHASSAFRGRSQAGLYEDRVQEIDWSVGQVLNSLHKVNLEHDTLVLFTSDNGPWRQGSAGDTRGRKNLPFEGGFRVPLIARWPGVLPEGTINGQMAVNLDLFATCLAAAGVPLPNDRVIDGVDLLPTLRGEPPTPHEAIYYYKGQTLQGVRQGKWKYMRRHMNDNGDYASLRRGPFLFNLETDPNESYSLIGSEPEIAAQLQKRMEEWDVEIKHNPRGWL